MRALFRLAWIAAFALPAACRMPVDRPVHPWKLEGFPGAPIEGDLFPLTNGRVWVFRDRLDPSGGEQTWTLEHLESSSFLLLGRPGGPVAIERSGDFLEIRREGALADRPLRFAGAAGDRWKAAGARCFALGYDRLEVLGEKRRALVVSVERRKERIRSRDLYWFADGIGWVRIRHEREGHALRDQELVGFEPGSVD